MKKRISSTKKIATSAKSTTKKPKKTYQTRLFLFYCLTAFIVGLGSVGIALIVPGRTQPFCANSVTCIHNLNAEVDNNDPGYFDGQEVLPPPIDLAETPVPSQVLGAETVAGEKHVFVDLSTQTLYAYQGTTQILQTLVSTGKWNPTPTGDYKIWIKIRSQRMAGGEGADAYNLPNVPFIMFFYNAQVGKGQGFSLHGAYWHDNFGHMMSHGCVNMRPVDAEAVYNWASPTTKGTSTLATTEDPGTTVSICNTVQIQDGEVPSCSE